MSDRKMESNKDREGAKTVYFVDPMSYNNLSIYDYSLISNIPDFDIRYYCSEEYDHKKKGMAFYPIYRYKSKTGLSKIISYFSSQLKLLNEVRNNDVAVVHFQWLKIPEIDYFLLKLIKRKVKIVFTAHNVLPHNSGSRYSWIFKKIYKLSDAIIVHSTTTKEELATNMKISKDKVRVIPHGVLDMWQNVDPSLVKDYERKLTKEFKLKDKLVFSALGNINEYKGIDLIADAWKLSNLSENENIKLILAGRGKHEKLEDLKAEKNVAILNRFLSTEEFLAILNLTDYLLLPYRQISQSGVLLTALNEKKRVIVSNVGGLKDPFDFGKIGYILEKLTAAELNKVIIQAIDEQDQYPDEKTWKQISNYFDWAGIGNKTYNLYNELCLSAKTNNTIED